MGSEVKTARGIPYDINVTHPEKLVKNVSDIQKWLRSKAYYDLLGFINGISYSIQGIRMSDSFYISDVMKNLIDIFKTLNVLVDETPPVDQPQRFGNKAFRAWSSKMHHDIFYILQKSIPEEKCALVTELGFYLSESFGNSVRIDYGTGHELSFLFFLCSLYKANILKEEDNKACVFGLFNEYLLFVRRLQKVYRMEPAGSQGVWSLDDYQFVPFIWGSAQLSLKSPFPPGKFLDDDIIEKYENQYMFISCIKFIQQVKTGHFAEHSYQLWSISAVQSWQKINSGLVKMYQKEILSKYPIIQHVYFGDLMSYSSVNAGTPLPLPRLGFLMPQLPASQKVENIGDDTELDSKKITLYDTTSVSSQETIDSSDTLSNDASNEFLN